MKLKVLDLFSGIGGFSLGLERTGGFETVAFCEIDPFCRRVLAKHWPDVPCFEDVTTLRGESVGPVDVICGGFPCQDISYAGLGAGLDGARSGLWSHYARLVGELRPLYVLVENVAALLGRGIDRVLGDLAALGYDAEWHCIPASAVGAPHRRDRVWIVAYPHAGNDAGELGTGTHNATPSRSEGCDAGEREAPHRQRLRAELGAGSEDLPDAASNGRAGGRARDKRRDAYPAREEQLRDEPSGDGAGYRAPAFSYANALNAQGLIAQLNDTLVRREQVERQARLCRGAGQHQDWSVEPAVGRVAHGVPDRVGQLRAYGNAVVPQIPELIGHAILQSMAA